MKAFYFRLQTSLDLAERQEQIAREELMTMTLKRDNIELQLAMAQKRLREIEQSIRNAADESMPLEKILVNVDYIPVVRELIHNLRDKLQKAEQEVEKARRILLDRVRETRTLNRLREKAWLSYLEECNREEQKLIDEIAITRHFRMNGGVE